MKEIILAIDIGHNVPLDRGAVGIRKEDELNKLVGNALISKCNAAGIRVINCTPTTASSLRDSLSKRCVAANRSGATIFISIHHNSYPGGYGSEVLCIKSNLQNGLSAKVGQTILNELQKLGLRNRGIKDRRDLFVLNETSMAALIVECAFVDSSSDMNNYNAEKVAGAIFNGLATSLGLNVSESNNQGSVSKTHIVQAGETLWSISKKYGTTVDGLVELNSIRNKNLINVGQKLIIK